MKNLIALAVVMGAATAWGREPLQVPPVPGAVVYQDQGYAPQPTPMPAPQLQPIPQHVEPGQILYDATAMPAYMPLYRNIVVRHPGKVHPCAVPKIVSVPDPCNPCGCVLIEICVPPCACESIDYRRGGDKVIFNYGKSSVVVISRGGKLIVRYS